MSVFHVTSDTISFARFLQDTGFPAYQSHEKGERSTVRKGYTYEDYGFSSEVSEREWTDLAGQIEDAYGFLRAHEQAIRELKSSHEVTDMRLDFPYSCRLNEQIFMQCDYLPSEFLKLAGDLGIGIELSHYPPTDEEENSKPASGEECS